MKATGSNQALVDAANAIPPRTMPSSIRCFETGYISGQQDMREQIARFFELHWRDQWKYEQIADVVRSIKTFSREGSSGEIPEASS